MSVTTPTTTPSELNFKNALLKGLGQSKPDSGRQLGQVGQHRPVQNVQMSPKFRDVLKQEKFPSDNVLEQLSTKFDDDSLKLRYVDNRILILKTALRKLKEEERDNLREEVNSSSLILNITHSLKNDGHVDDLLRQRLHDHLIGPDCKSSGVDTKREGYKVSIGLYRMIHSMERDQQNKDSASLQLALHELRIGHVQEADSIASLIEDNAIKLEYEHKKQNAHY